jgi:predicted DNA-binding transcriptional regulator AlpA
MHPDKNTFQHISAASEEDRLVDFAEVARMLGDISERSVRRLISKGELPQPVKVLSSPRLYLSDVLAYFEHLKVKREKSTAQR